MKLNWPDGRVANFLIGHYSKNNPKHPCDSIRNLVKKLKDRGCHISKKTYAARVHLLVKWGKFGEAKKIAEEAVMQRIAMRTTFESLLLGCAQRKQWSDQLNILNTMTSNGHQPGTATYVSLFVKCEELQMPLTAVFYLNRLKEGPIPLNADSAAAFLATQKTAHAGIYHLTKAFPDAIDVITSKECLESLVKVSLREREFRLANDIITYALQTRAVGCETMFNGRTNGMLMKSLFLDAKKPLVALRFFYSLNGEARRGVNASIAIGIIRHIALAGPLTQAQLITLTTAAEDILQNSSKKGTEIESLMLLYRDTAQVTKAEDLLANTKRERGHITAATYYSSLLSDIEG
eukprot:TRINITY_DN15491_c0_g1_i1.p1 TRINITY_DN15491_c0_g1~~TRINITY_DN15491_c0_g1_i1.p1  ORF type:complete len:349 (+),score=31.65 TRINITY_DN15491_c0_g1_i1:74-1120(+)